MYRILVLDISGMYSKIYDEIYYQNDEQLMAIKNKYIDSKYIFIKIR